MTYAAAVGGGKRAAAEFQLVAFDDGAGIDPR